MLKQFLRFLYFSVLGFYFLFNFDAFGTTTAGIPTKMIVNLETNVKSEKAVFLQDGDTYLFQSYKQEEPRTKMIAFLADFDTYIPVSSMISTGVAPRVTVPSKVTAQFDEHKNLVVGLGETFKCNVPPHSVEVDPSDKSQFISADIPESCSIEFYAEIQNEKNSEKKATSFFYIKEMETSGQGFEFAIQSGRIKLTRSGNQLTFFEENLSFTILSMLSTFVEDPNTQIANLSKQVVNLGDAISYVSHRGVRSQNLLRIQQVLLDQDDVGSKELPGFVSRHLAKMQAIRTGKMENQAREKSDQQSDETISHGTHRFSISSESTSLSRQESVATTDGDEDEELLDEEEDWGQISSGDDELRSSEHEKDDGLDSLTLSHRSVLEHV